MRKEKKAGTIRQRDLPTIEILQALAEDSNNELIVIRQGDQEIVVSAWLLRELADRLRSQANFMQPLPGRGGPQLRSSV